LKQITSMYLLDFWRLLFAVNNFYLSFDWISESCLMLCTEGSGTYEVEQTQWSQLWPLESNLVLAYGDTFFYSKSSSISAPVSWSLNHNCIYKCDLFYCS